MSRQAMVWWSAVAYLMLTGLCACHKEQHHEEERPSFDVTSVIKKTTEVQHQYVCQIRAIQHIELRALEQGYLRDILVDEGQAVRQGQPMFRIMPVLYEAEVARSTAEVQFAEVEYENTRTLRERNIVSPNELALSQAQLNKASAQRAVAQAHLRFASINAPFDGIVGRFFARRGSLLEEGDLISVLADNSQMWVYFNVSESEYLAYRRTHPLGERTPVSLRMANGEIFDQPGVIQTIEADFNNETGTIAFRAGFENPDGLLRHGETGAILLTTALPNALVIPQEATYTVLDKTFVFVVGQNNIVRAREITIGEELPHQYVVKTGLREGEHILIDGLRRVRDGDRIVPRMRDAEEVFRELNQLPAQ